MRYTIKTTAGRAVAVPSDWETAGAFKRLQRIINALNDEYSGVESSFPREQVAVDGKIGPKTAAPTLKTLRAHYPSDTAIPAWDMTPADQVSWVAANAPRAATLLAELIDTKIDDYTTSNAPGWLMLLSPVGYVWYGSRALRGD